MDIDKELDKDKEKEKDKKAYAPGVFLTTDEYAKLVREFGEQATRRMTGKLSAYKSANGKKYKSDYGAIRSWVVEACKAVPIHREPIKPPKPVEKPNPEMQEKVAALCDQLTEKMKWKRDT